MKGPSTDGGEPTETTRLIHKDDEEEEDQTWGDYFYSIVIAGTGFFADAYDLFVIDLVMSILMRLNPEQIGPWEKSIIGSSTLIGAVFGQVTFGLLGDWFGRKWTFVATCVLIIVGTLASGLCQWSDGPFKLVHQLALCRLVLGVGVGGEYPLAATIAAESSTKKNRGSLVAAVFSMQGWGMLMSCVVVLALLWAEFSLDVVWRAALIVGAIPSALVIVLRYKLEESGMFLEAAGNEAAEERLTLSQKLSASLGHIKAYWHPLVGTTMTWLILDITFYGTGSFKSRISGFLVETHAETAEEQIWHESVFAMICVCMAIPGYLLSVAYIDRIGRYNLQLGGFIAMAVNFALLAGLRPHLPGHMSWLLIVFFGLTFLFSNFGPNTTTFVIPSEVYPTVIRATCHGLSAAAGKIGAVIGVVAFSPCEEAFGLTTVLGSCSVVCIVGAIFTYYFTTDQVVDLKKLDRSTVPQTVPVTKMA
jgi:PHS family inorganic phosphate transporter-like MFS transporter